MNFSFKCFLSLLLPLVLLGGCTQPDKGESAGAAFYITDVREERTELTQIEQSSGWVVPKMAVYTIRACLEDRATQAQIVGHRFQVKTPDGTTYDALSATDASGCFRWKEQFPYNIYAAKTYFIPFTRKIIGTGVYNGERTIEFAVNPWTIGELARDRGASFVLLNDGDKKRDQIDANRTVPREAALAALAGDYRDPAIAGASDGIGEEAARIWVNDVSLKTIRRRTISEGVIMDIHLSMKPLLKLKDNNENIITKSVNQGSFIVTAHLVVTDTGINENEKLIITDANGVGGRAQIDLQQLTTQLRAKWTKRAHTGNVTLALRLTPVGLQGVQEFEGLFELGDLNSLTGSASAKVLPTCSHPTDSFTSDPSAMNTSDRPCQSIESFLKNVSNYEDLVKQGYASQNEPLIFDVLRLRFVSILPGETATQREVLYSASTCITNRFNGQKMADIPFVIEYLDENGNVLPEKSLKKTTNSVGCLMWNSTIHHAYYGPEAFVWHTVRIRTEKEDDNFAKIKRFALNPWDDKFTFGWDEEEFSPEFMKAKKAKSRFFLPRFSYHTVRFLYNIDPFMELEVKKTVLMDLQPRVLRYAGIVNARKQTEPLRDGIYLMKVAIQKDFLDPTERAVDVKIKSGTRKSVSQGGQEVPSVIMESLGPVTPREYITTDMSLVRVVDGHLIHPIELTMRDLRLMRVRSNFLIQFELVDERAIQAHDVFNKLMRDDFEKLKAKREAKEKARQAAANAREGVTDAELRQIEREELEKFEEEAKSIRQKYKNAFYAVKEHLENQPFINNDFQLDPDLLGPIKQVLEVNDFTEVDLPGKEEADLNLFVEKNAGLERRTFVGPVIFLSNAYSDSVRATDNLDEANCSEIQKMGQKRFIEGDEEDQELKDFGLSQSLLWENEGVDGEPATKDLRRNKAYRYSRYYGALTHLCFTHVDDLIEREEIAEENYQQVMPVASSKANLARTFGLDYMSMANEPLEELVPDQCEQDPFCKNLRSRSLDRNHVEKLLQYDYKHRAGFFGGWFRKNPVLESLDENNLTEALLPELDLQRIGTHGDPSAFKKEVSEPTDIFASCSILTDLAVERMMIISKDERGKGTLGVLGRQIDRTREQVARTIYNLCATQQSKNQSAVIVDEKFKVFKTGEDYVFRGGLQLNFNVGTSVSFSRSDAWGGTFKLDDIPNGLKGILAGGGALIGMVAGPGGALIGGAAGLAAGYVADMALSVIKPVGISRTANASNSDGTSVSQGTYLVSQMAKFDVPLESFERCRITRFSEDFASRVASMWGMSEDVQPFISKGFMVCGEKVNAVNGRSVLRVPETYFYFTQHFTEGDMLDQADLYNHPWLLSMRGLRDFGVFVKNIEAVEAISLGGFWNGLWEPQPKPLGWPLDHMAATYRQQVPTFPGFYTLSTYEQGITQFPLQERFSTVETDVNGEVNCTMEKSQNQRVTCAEKMAFGPPSDQ